MYPRRRWLEAKAAQAPEEWKQKLGLQDAVTTNGLSSVHMHVLWRFSTYVSHGDSVDGPGSGVVLPH